MAWVRAADEGFRPGWLMDLDAGEPIPWAVGFNLETQEYEHYLLDPSGNILIDPTTAKPYIITSRGRRILFVDQLEAVSAAGAAALSLPDVPIEVTL